MNYISKYVKFNKNTETQVTSCEISDTRFPDAIEGLKTQQYVLLIPLPTESNFIVGEIREISISDIGSAKDD